jgi:hypothetical protein
VRACVRVRLKLLIALYFQLNIISLALQKEDGGLENWANE